ncbi:MAG: hypothetical protein ACI4I4_05480 [Acutalibacteraceae bacterium]
MEEADAWTNFLQSGSVLDYLTYKSISNSRENPAGNSPEESENENQDGRSDYQGTKYW